MAVNYQEYDLDERKIGLITDASSMHDIGKIAIPDRILNKPGKLTPEEFDVMKTHTVKGCEILAGLGPPAGTGNTWSTPTTYAGTITNAGTAGISDGLKGDSIPICAQVVAIADCYDAPNDRPDIQEGDPTEPRVQHDSQRRMRRVLSPAFLECFKNVRNPLRGCLENMPTPSGGCRRGRAALYRTHPERDNGKHARNRASSNILPCFGIPIPPSWRWI